jgi:hypothetical protein
MRKKINQTGFIIAGAAALFVGLAANMQAVPITMHNNGEAGMRSWVLGRDVHGNEWILGQTPHGNEIAHLVDQSSRNQISTSPNAFLSGPVPAQNADGHNNPGRPDLLQGSQGAPTTTILPIAHGPASISVPDGGTTAMMMAGAFYGLALLRKTLKV